ncbi:hypothetical protein [Sphingomonas sp. STIS6.2]|uniref:hypothetical protein n=1 Tax=Sphingomonas sp. STIS6.2 TaxID=1379700 RepID=UPI00131E8AE7|nr:hypothetical protein [Sphingomonas sp. STIS6.2]
MNIVTVNIDRINNKPVADYLASTDRRVTIGVRFTLEALGIELPDFLCRKPAGRPGRAALMAAVDADTGTIATYRHERLKIGVFAPTPQR